jgi:hypothetical protein
MLAAMAFAQDTPPPRPQQAAPSAADKTAKDKSPDKSKDQDKTAAQSSNRPEEMQTQSYSGTLMDASCAGSDSAPSTPAKSADRAAASADKQSSCSVTASTTQFALKLKDGKTVKFDDVGNLRAQEAFKVHKKWSDSATASKPVHVKTGGVLNGDQLTVISID